MNKDLTVGEPSGVLLRFCIPLMGSIIFQQLYNIADSLIAGKCIGESALAAVGNSYEITLIFIAVSFGCNIGCSVVVSGMFGAGKNDQVKTAVSTALIAAAAICVVLMSAGLFFCRGLLGLINTPESIFADSLLYLRIYILGLPFLFFYNIATGIFSAMGDSRTPFWFLAVSSTSNILVDWIFVALLHMGVAGVGWATFLCQGVSCILALIFVIRRVRGLESREPHQWFSLSMLQRIAVVAIPSVLQQAFISVGNIILQGIINGYGAGVIAGYAAGVKLNNLVITCFTTLGNGISNYTAQNLGAGRTERVKAGFFSGLKMIWILCVPLVLLYFLCGRGLCFLFMDDLAGEAVGTGVLYLRILAPFYFVVSMKLVADGILRGSARMLHFMISTFLDLIMRVVLAFILSSHFGSVGIWMAWPIGWILGSLVSLYFCRKGFAEGFVQSHGLSEREEAPED